MNWQLTPYAVPLVAGAMVTFSVTVIAWQRRSTRGALFMMLLSLSIIIYSLAYILELGSSSIPDILTWLKVEYIGITTEPVILLMLILTYTNRQRFLTPLTAAVSLVVPIATLLFAWTNESHGLIWQNMTLAPLGEQVAVDFIPGSWYWVWVIYTWVLAGLGAVLLAYTLPRVAGLHRKQLGVMLTGVLIPLAVYLVYLADLAPAGLDLNPYALNLSGILIAWGMFNYQLFDIIPVAHTAVLSSMHDAVIVLDEKDRVVDLNPAARQLIGADAGRSVGRPASEVFGAYPDILAKYQDIQQAREEIEIDVQGEKRFFDIQLSPLCSRPGEYKGRLVVLRDITGRVQIETALKESNRRLTEMYEERDGLVKELEAFDRTVAHDLKNPLAVIIGAGGLLLERYEHLSTESIQKQLAFILRSARKADSIIEALLMFAGVRTTDRITIGALDMDAIVEESLLRLNYLIVEYNAETILPDSWADAQGYAPWVEEIWINYLSNAVKYGGRPPRVELGSDRLSDGVIRFWVRDNGLGLTPEEQSQLFKPFTRLEQQAHVKGHGLGLSIVQRITERLNGETGVESEVGKGSLFYFTLPAASGVSRACEQRE
ncbi:MAG: PAS domain-containing protein [Anaerolineae bacterium]|nr:PAS domain-containing protein [Anaerolineae bacterium]